MHTRILTYAALALLVPGGASCAGTPLLWGDLEPGPYPVGFSVLGRLDTTRYVPPDNTPRPVQVSLWYPARPSPDASRLTYRDYLLLAAHERDFDGVSPEDESAMLGQYRELLRSQGIPDTAVDAWLDAGMFALRDAGRAAGPFPLIIVAQGNFQSAHHQAVLSEYIASHGYVVATTPSPMRITGPMTDPSEVLSRAREQAADMAFTWNELKGLECVDPDRIGLVGHSFGARAALLLASELEGVDALVSLDGGIANRFGGDWLDGYDSFRPESIAVPVLHFYQETDDFVVPDFSLLESMDFAPRYLVRLDRMPHLYFTSLGMAAGTIPGFAPASVNRRMVRRNCAALCSLTLRFLDACLAGDEDERDALFPGSARKTLPESCHLTTMPGTEERQPGDRP